MVGLCLAAGATRAKAQAPTPKATPPAAQAEPAPATAAGEGQRIVLIRVLTEQGTVLRENPRGLPLQPGQPFGLEAEREALRQLYATGLYADIRAETSPVPGGVRLDFVVRENYYTNQVHVVGLRPPPDEPLAAAAMRLGQGEAFREEDVKDALERLRQALEDDGFYEPNFTHELRPRPETHQMDIEVRVTPGPRARVGAVVLRNSTEFSDEELRNRLKLRPGREVTGNRLDRTAERARKFLVNKGYLGARVALRRGIYEPKTNTLPLEITLTAGPQVRVQVSGEKVSQRQLRKLLPIYEEGSVDEDLLQEGRRNIRDYLERLGFFDARVTYTGSELPGPAPGKPGQRLITYEIRRGPRQRLVGLSFEGNKYFDDSLLRSRLRIEPAAFAARGRFSTELLQEDVASLRDLYVANGFEQTQVRSELVEDYQRREGDLFVRFHIQEGNQTRVTELKLEGNHALSDAELLAVIGSTPGQPYSQFNVSGDRDNILAVYYNDGFPEARFSASVEELPPETNSAGDVHRVRLIYHISEGTQLRVARVLVDGYVHTRPGVIRRQVQLKAGEPLSEGDVVETQRRLYNLGIFSRVAIAPQNPSGTDPNKTVVVLVDEAKRYTFSYGFGFEAQRLGGAGTGPTGGALEASPRGILELSKANFSGRGDTLSFKGRASTLQGRGLVSYTTQNLFARPDFNLQLTGFADKTRDVLTFTSTRYEGSLQVSQRVSLVTSLLYRYTFRRVLVDASSLKISPQQIPLFSQPTKVSLFGTSWVRDRRNSPANPTRGDFNTVDVSLAGKPIGSSASFLRVFLQNSTYHALGRRLVFARSARFGVQTPVGDTVSTEIPLPERFFAGGGSSLRGFGLNQAGPRDPVTGFPIGGQAMLILNQELRFPMRLPFVGTRVGGALFYDGGNVFSRIGRVNLRWAPPSPVFNPATPGVCQFNCTNELNYFSHTVGFGLRYATPIGPVSLDFAYQLNPAVFLVPNTTGGQTTMRLPRFQFFINLGSIF